MLDMADFALFEEEISRIYSELETELISFIVKELSKGKGFNDVSEWATWKLGRMTGLRGRLKARISSLMQDSVKDLEKEIEKMVRLSSSEDASYFRDIQLFARTSVAESISIISSEEVTRRVRAIMRNCRDSLNLTNTGALEAALQSYRDAINRAYVSVAEGTASLDTAIRKACTELGGSGIQLTYMSDTGKPSTISIDAGIRRNIVTSVNQMAAEYTMEDCEANECDLVQTSAHAGARPSHQVWQGKVFSISGKSKKYGKLSTETGYGTPGGLCGINCKHSFFPYYEGMSKTDWHIDLTPRENEELYNDLQKQRAYERRIRAWKRRRIIARDMHDRAGMKRASAGLEAAEVSLSAFLKEADLPRRLARERV